MVISMYLDFLSFASFALFAVKNPPAPHVDEP